MLLKGSIMLIIYHRKTKTKQNKKYCTVDSVEHLFCQLLYTCTCKTAIYPVDGVTDPLIPELNNKCQWAQNKPQYNFWLILINFITLVMALSILFLESKIRLWIPKVLSFVNSL